MVNREGELFAEGGGERKGREGEYWRILCGVCRK